MSSTFSFSGSHSCHKSKKNTATRLQGETRQCMYCTPNALFILLTSRVTGFSQIARLPHNADNTRRRAVASIFSEMPHRGGIIDCPTIHNYKTAKLTQILCSLKAETKFWR